MSKARARKRLSVKKGFRLAVPLVGLSEGERPVSEDRGEEEAADIIAESRPSVVDWACATALFQPGQGEPRQGGMGERLAGRD